MLRFVQYRWLRLSILGLCVSVLVGTAIVTSDLGEQGMHAAPTLRTDYTIPTVDTRGNVADGGLSSGTRFDAFKLLHFPQKGLLPLGSHDEAIIVIHGFNNTEAMAMGRFGVARQALRSNGFQGAVIGYMWDSDTALDPENVTGYRRARRAAELNGPMLARFLRDFKAEHPGARISILGYSLGARVALEGLAALEATSNAKDSEPIVSTTYLMGAAVGIDEVGEGGKYYEAIVRETARCVNYFSRKDDILRHYYRLFEDSRAVGTAAVNEIPRPPRNLTAKDVADDLPTVSNEGVVSTLREHGEDHSGYLGVRNGRGALTDDGAMDDLVEDLKAHRRP